TPEFTEKIIWPAVIINRNRRHVRLRIPVTDWLSNLEKFGTDLVKVALGRKQVGLVAILLSEDHTIPRLFHLSPPSVYGSLGLASSFFLIAFRAALKASMASSPDLSLIARVSASKTS